MLIVPWRAWCRAVEVGLLSAYKAAGLCPQGDQPFLGTGTAVIRSRLVGGRAPGRLHRSARADEVDAHCHVFVDASLAPVILFRRRLYSVGAVLKRYQEKWPFYCGVGGCVRIGPHRPHEDSGSLEGLASRSINRFLALDELEPVCPQGAGGSEGKLAAVLEELVG